MIRQESSRISTSVPSSSVKVSSGGRLNCFPSWHHLLTAGPNRYHSGILSGLQCHKNPSNPSSTARRLSMRLPRGISCFGFVFQLVRHSHLDDLTWVCSRFASSSHGKWSLMPCAVTPLRNCLSSFIPAAVDSSVSWDSHTRKDIIGLARCTGRFGQQASTACWWQGDCVFLVALSCARREWSRLWLCQVELIPLLQRYYFSRSRCWSGFAAPMRFRGHRIPGPQLGHERTLFQRRAGRHGAATFFSLVGFGNSSSRCPVHLAGLSPAAVLAYGGPVQHLLNPLADSCRGFGLGGPYFFKTLDHVIGFDVGYHHRHQVSGMGCQCVLVPLLGMFAVAPTWHGGRQCIWSHTAQRSACLARASARLLPVAASCVPELGS